MYGNLMMCVGRSGCGSRTGGVEALLLVGGRSGIVLDWGGKGGWAGR